MRTLASLCHTTLLEFAMNSAVDTAELLGGFEQVWKKRKKFKEFKFNFLKFYRLMRTDIVDERWMLFPKSLLIYVKQVVLNWKLIIQSTKKNF